MALRDKFLQRGPNGTHQCFVFDVMGPSASSMVKNFRVANKNSSQVFRYPLCMAKSILRQTLLGLNYLHANGIAHGDLQPGNLLFPVKDLTSIDETQLMQQHVDWGSSAGKAIVSANGTSPSYPSKKGVSQPVKRIDGKVDRWAPRYLSHNQSLNAFVDTTCDFRLKIADMGASFLFEEPPIRPATPLGLRSPELMLTGKISKDQDVWSFGCLLFEFITGRKLFCIANLDLGSDSEFEDAEEEERVECPLDPITGDPMKPNDRDANDDHLLQLTDILGPVPKALRLLWSRSPIYFDEEGRKIKNYIGKLPDDMDPTDIKPFLPLKELFDQEKPPEMDIAEAGIVKELLTWILQYDPVKRPSVSDLTQHHWFQISSDDIRDNDRI